MQTEIREIDGLKLHVRPNTSDVQCFEEIFVKQGYKRLKTHGGLGGRVLDLGGYVGYFAIWAIKNGATSVVSYEPDPVSAKLFRMNLALNGYEEKVELREQAVSQYAGHRLLYISRGGRFWRNTLMHDKKQGSVMVRVAAFSDVLYGKYSAVKADIEGMEKDFIFSLSKDDKINMLILEYSFDINFKKSDYEMVTAHLNLVFNECHVPKVNWGVHSEWQDSWVPPAKILFCKNI